MVLEGFSEKILLIEQDAKTSEAIELSIRTLGLATVTARDGQEALKKFREDRFFLVLCDYRLPQVDGIELCRQIRQVRPSVCLAVMSAYSDKDAVLQSTKVTINEFLDKPVQTEKLLDMVKRRCQERLEAIQQERHEIETIKNLFIEEAKEIIGNLEPCILLLEDDPDNKTEINNLFRYLHTLKGSSATIQGATEIRDLSHAFESVLSAVKEDKLSMSKDLIDLMLSSIDLLQQGVDSLETGRAGPVVGEAIELFEGFLTSKGGAKKSKGGKTVALNRSGRKEEADEGVVVSNEKLDNFMELAGELVAFKNAFYGFVKQRSEGQTANLDDQLRDMNKALSKLTEELQNKIMDVRKISLNRAFAKFPRMIRQIANDLNKEVRYETHGLELQVDKTVAKALAASLVHVVRNSCDHGIETSAERRRSKKGEAGRLSIRAQQTADIITVQVHDDGRGLDKEKIYRKARERGLVSKEFNKMTEQEIFDLLFLPGFSTKEEVTDLSGRGVGMDVVKTAVLNLGGQVRLESETGVSTTLTLSLPVPKSIIVEQSIVARSQGLLIAIPLSYISDIKHIAEYEFTFIHPFWMVQHNGRPIPIVTYSELVEASTIRQDTPDFSPKELVIVIAHKDSYVALRVEQIVDQLEAVVRPFDRVTHDVPGFKGTSQLPGDELAYMLSAEALVQLADKNKGALQRAA